MLSVTRCNEHLYPVPKFDLGKGDIRELMNELRGFHEQFANCFQRSESREYFIKYMTGQFSTLERKSIELIALAVKDGSVVNKENMLPFKYVFADSIYGISPEFITSVESMLDKNYFVSIPKDTLCWIKRPMTITKKYRWGGKTQTKIVLVDPDSKPLAVEDLAKNINVYFWCRRQVSEGTKGPIVYEFTRRQVILSTAGLPQKTVWLLIRRTLGDDPQYSFFISNASSSTRLKTLVWLSSLRWAIEQCFEETKDELGINHYEVRKFTGWQHHMLTCILAHFFLWHLKIRMEKKSTVYYAIAA